MTDYSTYNEKELLLKIASGDAEAFKIIYDQYRNKIFSIARRVLKSDDSAEDVVQDIFMKLWQNKKQLGQLDNVDAYITTVTQHHVYNQFKRLALESTYLQFLKAEVEGKENLVFPDPAILKELRDIYANAIATLTPQQKKVYLLGKQEGLKYEEIAHLLNISRDTVKDHMSAALLAVKQYIKQYNYNPAYVLLAETLHILWTVR